RRRPRRRSRGAARRARETACARFVRSVPRRVQCAADDRHRRALPAAAGPPAPAVGAMMGDVKSLLRWVFATKNALTLPVSGTGSAGMECCVVNLVEPGDEVVIGVNGVFGTRMAEVAERAGASVVRVEAPWGTVIRPRQLADALARAKRPKLLGGV